MRLPAPNATAPGRSGFTLAEVAVTIVIVGIALVLLLQGLGGSKAQAFHTRNIKLASQLGRMTLGEVASGLYRDDAEFGTSGTYADLEYPEFSYEVFFGEDDFPVADGRRSEAFDSWEHQRDRERQQREREQRDDDTNYADEDDEDEQREPFEKVQVRVTFPTIGDYENELVLVQWIPWDQVYGPPEEDEDSGGGSGGAGGSTGGGSAAGRDSEGRGGGQSR